MTDVSGNDLLKVFKELDIHLLNLNPNLIKAWFDTDDRNVKNLLNWMCVSLSRKNYISPLEVSEYIALEPQLSDEDLESEMKQVENQYPGIFDKEYNALEIEFLEEELKLAEQQERELNQSILLNRNLEQHLTKELSKKVKDEIEISVKLKTTQDKCLAASKKLDSLNKTIHNHLLKCTTVIHDFEFSPTPSFITNFEINMYQEKLDNMLILLKPVLDKSSIGSHSSLANITYIEGVPFDETVSRDLSNMRHRILHSQNKYLATTIEVEKLKAILAYLEKTTIESLLSSDSSLNESFTASMETKKRLCDMLEDVTKNFVDRQMNQSQVIYLEQEVEMHRQNLDELTNLGSMLQKLLSHYLLLGILFDGEKKDLEKLDIFFRKVMMHINRDMESSIIRTEKMKDIIENYKTSSGEKLKLTKVITKMLSSTEDCSSIGRAYELISDIKRENDFLEMKLFNPCFGDIKSKGKDLRNSVKVLQTFLVNGPTHRVVLAPAELQIAIRQVEEIVKNELKSVKSIITTSSVKKLPSKWKNYRRQLWMYFYADPSRLKFILQQIEEEFKKSNIKSQMKPMFKN